MATTADRPAPGVTEVYVTARDLAAMRVFYTELLGLDEIHHSRDERLLAYRCGGLQLTNFEAADAPIAADGWATQPGGRGNTGPAISWSVVLTEGGYRRAVEALRAASATACHDAPVWVGYLSFPVRDPMGNTVELSLPVDEPATTEWSAVPAPAPPYSRALSGV